MEIISSTDSVEQNNTHCRELVRKIESLVSHLESTGQKTDIESMLNDLQRIHINELPADLKEKLKLAVDKLAKFLEKESLTEELHKLKLISYETKTTTLKSISFFSEAEKDQIYKGFETLYYTFFEKQRELVRLVDETINLSRELERPEKRAIENKFNELFKDFSKLLVGAEIAETEKGKLEQEIESINSRLTQDIPSEKSRELTESLEHKQKRLAKAHNIIHKFDKVDKEYDRTLKSFMHESERARDPSNKAFLKGIISKAQKERVKKLENLQKIREVKHKGIYDGGQRLGAKQKIDKIRDKLKKYKTADGKNVPMNKAKIRSQHRDAGNLRQL